MIMSAATLDLMMRLIWNSALTLVLVGLTVMLALVLRRLAQEVHNTRYGAARAKARAHLMSGLGGAAGKADPGGEGASALAALPPAELSVLVDEVGHMVRGEARERLAETGAAHGLDSWLIGRLKVRRPGRRIEAIRRLSLFANPWVRGHLYTMLDDKVPAVRLAAAEALVELDGDLDFILGWMRKEPATGTRQALLLLRAIAERHTERFIRLLDAEPSPARKALMVEVLAQVNAMHAAPAIIDLADAEDAVLRAAALAGLARMGHPRVRSIALARLRDPAPAVRQVALRALGGAPRKEDASMLQGFTADEDGRMRWLARRILADLGLASDGVTALEGGVA